MWALLIMLLLVDQAIIRLSWGPGRIKAAAMCTYHKSCTEGINTICMWWSQSMTYFAVVAALFALRNVVLKAQQQIHRFLQVPGAPAMPCWQQHTALFQSQLGRVP